MAMARGTMATLIGSSALCESMLLTNEPSPDEIRLTEVFEEFEDVEKDLGRALLFRTTCCRSGGVLLC